MRIFLIQMKTISRYWHRQAQISDWFWSRYVQLQSVIHESGRICIHWNQNHKVHQESPSGSVFGRRLVLNMRSPPWPVLLPRNVLFSVRAGFSVILKAFMRKFWHYSLNARLLGTSVAPAGNGNTHRIRHYAITNRLRVTPSHSSWSALDHSNNNSKTHRRTMPINQIILTAKQRVHHWTQKKKQFSTCLDLFVWIRNYYLISFLFWVCLFFFVIRSIYFETVEWKKHLKRLKRHISSGDRLTIKEIPRKMKN